MSTGSAAPPSAPPANTGWLWVVRAILILWLLALGIVLWKGAPEELAVYPIFEVPWDFGWFVIFVIVFYLGILVGLFTRGWRQALSVAFDLGTVIFVIIAWSILASARQPTQGSLTGWTWLVIVLAWGFGGAALPASALRAFYALGQEKGDLRKLAEGIIAAIALLLVFIMCRTNTDVHMRRDRDEASTVGSLETLHRAEVTYAETYKTGYAPNLAALRFPPPGAEPSPSAAGFIDSRLASGVRMGYAFTYAPGPADKAGHIQTYTVTAWPLKYGESGQNSYFMDQSGIIRYTTEDRLATAKDPPRKE